MKYKSKNWDLIDLLNPRNFQENIDIENYSSEFLISILNSMLIIRLAEEMIAHQRENGTIGGPVHLSAGQEAVAVGIAQHLKKTDRVFGAHRSHSHILAMEPCFYELFAEVLGKQTGLSKGMGGSMHLINQKSGFYGSVPIVAGTVPLAVGASFDALRNNKKDIGLAYLGDGAIEEGVVHESLNLAKILCCPTLFVVENNLFSSHMHISLRQPKSAISRFAEANDIEHEIIDGNDILDVYKKSGQLIKKIRNGEGPKFIEAITYRHYGHVDWRKDIDVGVNRSQEDLEHWMKRDPILRLKNSLEKKSIFSKDDFEEMHSSISAQIEKAWKKAAKDPYPKHSELLKRVYSDED